MTTFLTKYDEIELDKREKSKTQNPDCMVCPTCDCQWFEKIDANRYPKDYSVILGQDLPPENNTVAYLIMRCLRCQNLVEPHILHNSRDVAGGLGGSRYDHFLDTLQGKYDKRSKAEQKNKDAIKSERL